MTTKQIIIWAIVIRLLIIPFFFHPDIKDINIRVSFLRSEGVLNIYEYLKQNAITKVNAPDFAYPPLTYFTLGSYQGLVHPFLGEQFDKWLFDFSGLSSSSIYIFRYLFFLKIPFLIFDLLVGLILLKLASDKNKQRNILFFWFFNPLNLYAIYMLGQFDIIPSFLTFLSWYLWENKKIPLAGLALGLGAAFKSFPLLLLPLFILSKQTIKNKLIFSLLALFSYGASILPFIKSSAFQQDVLFSGLSKRIFELQFNFWGLSISLFMIFYILALLLWLKFRDGQLWIYILIILLIVFSTSRFNPQWIVWLTPFLSLAFVKTNIKIWDLSLFFISYFLVFALFGDRFLTTGLLSPISNLYLEIPELTQLFALDKVSIFRQITQLSFILSSLLIIWRVFKYK